LAPVVGPHQPSPLGRYLRLPVVPLPGTGSSPFALVHPDDAARALAAAAFAVDLAGPHNVVAPGTTTPWRVVRAGRRAPLVVVGPRWGPPWLAVRRVAELLGTPVPDHVLELLRRGRQARVTPRLRDLGGTPVHNTVSIIEDLYAWGPAAPSPA
jgi:UDP-glucose 4-epimerase